MFDSQNNNRGGYNKGDVDDSAAGGNIHQQYDMKHFMGDQPRVELSSGEKVPVHGSHAVESEVKDATGQSWLTVEWTNQHGCGGNEHDDPHKTNCNLNIQYMCTRQYARSRARLDCTGRCKIKDVDYHNRIIDRELDYDCSVENDSPCRENAACLAKCAGTQAHTTGGRVGMCEFTHPAYDTAFTNANRRKHSFMFFHDVPGATEPITSTNCGYDPVILTAQKAALELSFGIETDKGEAIEEVPIQCPAGYAPSCPAGEQSVVCRRADGATTPSLTKTPPSRKGIFFKVTTVAKWDKQDHYVHNCPHRACTGTDTLPCGSQTDGQGSSGPPGNGNGGDISYRLRDGTTTNRQEFTNPSNAETETTRLNRWLPAGDQGNEHQNRGLHESWEWYDECYRRERNRGLFTADQNLRNNNLGYSSAVYTRQNPNNNRRGYECPEERDYWPYWHPSPWRDIAVLTDRLDLCPHFQAESQNVKAKYHCRNTVNNFRAVRFNTERKCIENRGKWEMVPSHGLPPPECKQAPWSRVNHLGNGRFGQANTYNWSIPYDVLADAYGVPATSATMGNDEQNLKCVLRLRYNMTTDDYDGWQTDSDFNQNKNQGIKSPVQQNPEVNLGADMQALRLAINTAQFGRTFQDRSHVFHLVPRTEHPNDPNINLDGVDIYNLNVRGKRCNIVQCFPSVEYDFVPNHLHIKEGDVVHFQWTGSNTHNNGNPAGDGQAGDAGEGTGGTDRHNVVEMLRDLKNSSFPATWEENTLFKNAIWGVPLVDRVPEEGEVGADASGIRYSTGRPDWTKSCGTDYTTGEVDANHKNLDAGTQSGCDRPWKHDMAMAHGSSHFYKKFPVLASKNGVLEDLNSDTVRAPTKAGELNNLLNNADASVNLYLFKPRQGHYNYMCTRNHNFSNRDQKGSLVVSTPSS
jgi:hypothetical protein